MIKLKDVKKYEDFKLNCPHRYNDCGSIEPKSDCMKCFEAKKYDTTNGYSFEEIMKKETSFFNEVVELSKTVSR